MKPNQSAHTTPAIAPRYPRMALTFGDKSMKNPSLARIKIEDDLSIQKSAAIEVTIELGDGNVRWCYFTTPNALAEFGDYIDGTKIRFHYGSPHMIVVSTPITDELVHRVLRDIETRGDLLTCTLTTENNQAEPDGSDAAACRR